MDDARRIHLPYLLSALLRAEFCGRLGLTEGDVERTILFHAGSPVHVQSLLQEETLGRILLDEGKISLSQYKDILDTMVKTGRPAGEVLISAGLMGPQEVFNALEFQVRKKLVNCFKMVAFEFRLQEETIAPELLIARLDAAELILSGVMTCYSVDRLLNEFPVDEDTVFMTLPLPEELAVKIGSKENRILRSLGTGMPLAKLMASGIDLRYLLSVLYAFHALHLLEASGVKRPAIEMLGLAGLEELEFEPPVYAQAVDEIELEIDVEEENFRPPTLASIMEGAIDSKLAKKVLAMAREDHFSLLGIERGAQSLEVSNAFHQLLREFQLESIDQAYPKEKERELAQRLLDRAAVAYRILFEDESRSAYLRELSAEGQAGPREIPPRILADVDAQKGLLAMRAKRWAQAEQLFGQAIERYPKEPSYYFLQGKLEYLRALDTTPAGQPLPESIRKPLLKALALDPRYDQPRLYLGYLAKRNGNLKLAYREFSGALECSPQNQVAQSELRLLKRRLRDDEEKP